ncbi:hypothetical protein DXF93_28990 [Escherichia coli]|nr:hypothetical protein DXF93_28990 [Escherichia coli]
MSVLQKGWQFGEHSKLISQNIDTADCEILNGDIAEKLIKAHNDAAKKFIIYSTRAVGRPDVLDTAKHYQTVMSVLSSVINALPSREQPGAEDIIAADDVIYLPMSALEYANEHNGKKKLNGVEIVDALLERRGY